MKIILFCFVLLFSYSYAMIHVIGDSHSLEFSNIDNTIIHYLGPRTMHRIGREGKALLDFKRLEIQDNDTVVLVFGEIDVRCHIGKQKELNNRSLNEIINTLLDNFFKTILDNLSQYSHLNILTYTVTPPSLLDHIDIHYGSYGTLAERIFISKLLNKKLIEMSYSFGFRTIDVYDDYSDKNGALIYCLSDGNVHINSLYNQAIQKKLNDCLGY